MTARNRPSCARLRRARIARSAATIPLSALLSPVLAVRTIGPDNELERRLVASGERARVVSVVMRPKVPSAGHPSPRVLAAAFLRDYLELHAALVDTVEREFESSGAQSRDETGSA